MILSLTGPSGIGKRYLARHLKDRYPFLQELRWFTTRPLRPEEETDNRHSVSSDEFRDLAESSRLILVQELFGFFYGLDLSSVDYQDGICLCELHIDNLVRTEGMRLPLFSIALIPASPDLLEKRLRHRGTENEKQIIARLDSAMEEVAKIRQYSCLFRAILEVSEENESSIVEEVTFELRKSLGGEW